MEKCFCRGGEVDGGGGGVGGGVGGHLTDLTEGRHDVTYELDEKVKSDKTGEHTRKENGQTKHSPV